MASISSPSHSPGPPHSTFPQNPEEFDADPRVSWSKLDSKFILETEDGQEYEFDDGLKRWVPVLDDALLEQQRAAYAVQGVDELEPAQAGKKRKKKEYVNGEEDDGGRATTKKVKPIPEPRERKNTAVYVTSLPPSTTVDELRTVFSRCGVIAEEIDSGKPRIKLYTDDNGNFKGDALIVFFRGESVELAIQLLDDTELRLGDGSKMRVTVADFSYKSQKDAPAKSSMKDKKKIIKKTQKLNNKLADWDDDDPQILHGTSNRWDKVVILKHMFTLEELEEDPAAILDIKEDIREECSKMGTVTNVVLFDKEPDGVASVRFGNAEEAEECVRVMNGRHFSGMVVEAYIADGSEKFKKSSEKKAAIQDDEGEDEGKRLDEFGQWLEAEGESARSKT
ncbi:hypothetical protein MMC21_001446 [Puttea exsequens]|nr:hypothetical protein [Puttea exsequens]